MVLRLEVVANHIYGYSHLSNNRGGDAKVANSINVEVGINLEGGFFLEKTST